MKEINRKTTLFLCIGLLFLLSCQHDRACECLDENLKVVKAFRLRGYKGNCKKTGAVCDPFRGSETDFRKFDKKTRHCPHHSELGKETRLMNAHFLKRQRREAEKIRKSIKNQMDSLEEKRENMRGGN